MITSNRAFNRLQQERDEQRRHILTLYTLIFVIGLWAAALIVDILIIITKGGAL